MVNNTDLADINEIMLGFHLANGWTKFQKNTEAKTQLKIKVNKVGTENYDTQNERAERMAEEVLKWTRINGYNSKINKVWWTARPGILSAAVGKDVDSRKNPTDVLLQFSNKSFLGLSAKSTKGTGDIGFKNPGLGTIEKITGLDLKKFDNAAVKKLIEDFPHLSKTNNVRKLQIRKKEYLKEEAEKLGLTVLRKIRNELFNYFNKQDNAWLSEHIIDSWLDAKNVTYPPYIKITGTKNDAKIEDPLNNPKVKALSHGKIKISKVGNDSIGVQVGPKRILKMRVKYESQKLATSIKFSGDPW